MEETDRVQSAVHNLDLDNQTKWEKQADEEEKEIVNQICSIPSQIRLKGLRRHENNHKYNEEDDAEANEPGSPIRAGP